MKNSFWQLSAKERRTMIFLMLILFSLFTLYYRNSHFKQLEFQPITAQDNYLDSFENLEISYANNHSNYQTTPKNQVKFDQPKFERKQNNKPKAKVISVIELNSATKEQLMSINGIGEKFSDRILKYRQLLGGYVKKTQLLEVYGLKQENYNQIAKNIKINQKAIVKIDINNANFKELLKHPYLEYKDVKAIVDYRKLKNIKTTQQLVDDNVTNVEIIKKIEPYLIFNEI